MKKRTFLLNLFMAISAIALVACNDDDADYVQPIVTIEGADEFGARKLEFTNKSETQQIEITANGDWFIRIPEAAESWLTVTPREGKGGGPITIDVDVAANDKTDDRKATLALVCNKIEQKALLTVEQEKKYVLKAESNRRMINKAGGAIVISVSTNADWSYEIDEAGKTWLTENNTESSSSRLALTATELDEEMRTAAITFTCAKQADLKTVVNLTQKDLELYTDKSKAYFAHDGGDILLDVKTTNVSEWDVEKPKDAWVTAVKEGDKVKLTVAAFGKERRETTVNLVTPVDASMVFPITVIQRATPSGPVADILDVVFDDNGEAHDVSALNNPVKYVAGTPCSLSWNDVYLKYVPSFSHKQAGSNITSGFYRIEYTDAIMSALNDGYTIETLIKPGKAPNGSEIKAFSATTSGGMAIMIANTARKKGLEFIQHNNSKWCFATTDIVPDPDVYYHVVGVWDKAAGEIRCYVNGELKATASCAAIKHMMTTATRTRAFCIGGNTQSNTQLNGAWNGDVAIARIYDDPLTAEEIKELYENVKE